MSTDMTTMSALDLAEALASEMRDAAAYGKVGEWGRRLSKEVDRRRAALASGDTITARVLVGVHGKPGQPLEYAMSHDWTNLARRLAKEDVAFILTPAPGHGALVTMGPHASAIVDMVDGLYRADARCARGSKGAASRMSECALIGFLRRWEQSTNPLKQAAP